MLSGSPGGGTGARQPDVGVDGRVGRCRVGALFRSRRAPHAAPPLAALAEIAERLTRQIHEASAAAKIRGTPESAVSPPPADRKTELAARRRLPGPEIRDRRIGSGPAAYLAGGPG